jgi:two-component system, NtrC family, nitrogen regulation response regulator GlnG
VTKPHILIIDDEEAVCWSLQRGLERLGYAVRTAATAEKAIKAANEDRFDAALVDVRLPTMDGVTAVEKLRALQPTMQIAVMTAFGDLDTAVRAMAAGASEYLAKPFEWNRIQEVVKRLVESRGASSEARPQEDSVAGEMIGRSAAMQEVFKRIALAAPRDSCVLIAGETGTGKELVARAIHRFSNRRDKPFVPVHLAAMSANLIESELFGHVKGAFSGATETRVGHLESAAGGTIFLDEVGEMDAAAQVKLLRVIERKELTPVGSSTPKPVDIRIVAATHRDLSAQVAAGKFRQDLFFRLNVFGIELPPLRARIGDIPLLAEHRLRALDPNAPPLPASTVEYLQSRSWPGNVRELFHAIEHASIVSQGAALLPHHFPEASSATNGDALDIAVAAWFREQASDPTNHGRLHAGLFRKVEESLIEQALKKTNGNRWQAARLLGISRTTVRKKIEEFGLEAAVADDAEPDESGD